MLLPPQYCLFRLLAKWACLTMKHSKFKRLSPSKSRMNRGVVFVKMRANISETSDHFSNFHRSDLATVAPLYRSVRPTAILRRIVTVIVDAVQRHSGWTFSHVRQEILKARRAKPSFANDDSSAAIILEPNEIWIVAARQHVVISA